MVKAPRWTCFWGKNVAEITWLEEDGSLTGNRIKKEENIERFQKGNQQISGMFKTWKMTDRIQVNSKLLNREMN